MLDTWLYIQTVRTIMQIYLLTVSSCRSAVETVILIWPTNALNFLRFCQSLRRFDVSPAGGAVGV